MKQLPLEFEERMKTLLGDEYEKFIKAFDEPPTRITFFIFLIINTIITIIINIILTLFNIHFMFTLNRKL